MSYLEYLKNKKSSADAIYLEFLLEYKKRAEQLFIFVEGRDDPSFYINCLTRLGFDRNKIYCLPCNSKANVLLIFNTINWNLYERKRVLFFIDKDFSDILGQVIEEAENIYTTTYYSFENYLVTQEIVESINSELLNISRSNKISEYILAAFTRLLGDLYIKCKTLIATIIYMRAQGINANINNIKLFDILHFTDNLLLKLKIKKLDELVAYINKNCGVQINDLNPKDLTLFFRTYNRVINKKNVVRGKYELAFLVKFYEKIVPVINRLPNGDKIKFRSNLSCASAVEILAPRCSPPTRLVEFIEAIKC